MCNLKERFHFAKLSLSNARYLAELSEELKRRPLSEASALYNESMKKCGHGEVPMPINQAVFLQMAYVSLVWLSEALTKDQRGKIRRSFALANFPSVAFEGFDDDPAPGGFFRHIRNSLAHASVETHDQPFGFTFTQGGKKISMGAADLGLISEQWVLKVSQEIFPG